ncbi:MAG: aminotransferase class V-fold PLP-dependent enzyme [Verrucomicrobia bacterium]|nr:aminotransferase class V-fold PLP-dependent enzyme [Verrucomicrobiota bacterium]
MTPTEIQGNEELRRHEFPVVLSRVFLGHAAVCPLPRRVAEAISQQAFAGTLEDQEAGIPGGYIAGTRGLIAKILGVEAGEIALIGSTSMGLSQVAAGLPWRKGQNVVVYQDDYPSNVYPWMALAERGVEVRFLNIRELGRIRAIDVQGQVDEDTRLVALSSAHFVTGWRLEVQALGRWLRSRGILFCLDAIQTLGAFQTPLEQVDFMAADGHKWLLGPLGAGVLYVRKEVQEILRPTTYGWHNVECPGFVTQDSMVLRRDARRYEAGSLNLIGVAGLRAAFSLLEKVGLGAIEADLLAKRRGLVSQLQERGMEVLNPSPTGLNEAGVVSFCVPGESASDLHRKLQDEAIVVSLRTTRDGRDWIRVSPHYYNTVAELERFLEVLTARA